MLRLLLLYLAGALVSTGALVLSLWLYERRLTDDRPFNQPERWLYRLGLALDVAYNLLVLSPLFLELPQRYRETASQRFLRHRAQPGYRGAIARLCWRCFIHPAAPQHDRTMQRKFPHEE